MSRIWENLRYGIPRRTREFLEPETPAEMGGLLGASMVPGVGEAIDVADFAAGWKDRDLGRMGWATGGLFAPFVAGSTMRKVLGKGAKAADERVVFREADSDIGAEGMEGLNRPGRAYRGMEAAEYDATVGSGSGVLSRQDYSTPGEGTSFADDIRDAESYANTGRSDPRITGRPNYIVEVDATDLTRSPDGYLKASGEVPPERIERVWKITDEDGALVGREVAKVADELPMDEASRVGRREDWISDSTVKDRVYHGTTRDIKEFGGEYGNPENHYGAHHYFTDNADDASINYAGEGPDLKSRIELEGDRMFGDGQGDEEILDYWRDRDVHNLGEIDDLTHGQQEEAMRQLVKEQLGIEHGGAVIPARLRIRNPVVVGGDKETRWLFEQEFDEAGDFVGESGDAIELIDETRAALRDWDVYNSDTVMEEILGLLDDGEIAASDFDRVIRNSVTDLYDDVAGESASSGALIADIWKRMGYDAIDMDASVFSRRRGFGGVKLPGMAGTEGARHYVVFDPQNIRSDIAARFDPAQAGSASLIAGGAGLLGTGMARQRERR